MTAIESQSHRLVQFGITLFLLGLVTGLVVQYAANPRMALASHIAALTNGTFLVALGLLWQRLALLSWQLSLAFWLAVYATFANWAGTLLAAFWAAGNSMMPIAAEGRAGSAVQEGIITTMLISLGIAFLVSCAMVLKGLRWA